MKNNKDKTEEAAAAEEEIVIPGYSEINGVLMKVNRVLKDHSSIKITIKKEVALLAKIKVGDTLLQYYDPKLKAVVMKPVRLSSGHRTE